MSNLKNKYFLYLSSALIVIGLAGCATPYSKSTAFSPNGFSDVMLDTSRAVITFKSARADRSEMVIKGAMLRAAELSKENGFDGFLVISDSSNQQTSSFQSGGFYQGTRVGNQTFGSFTAGVPIVINMVEQRLTVQFFKKDNLPAGGYLADDVIKRNRPSFK
jgi:hypothetical protein